MEELHRLAAAIRRELDDFKQFSLPRFFRFLPIWLFFLVLLVLFTFSPVLFKQAGLNPVPMSEAGAALAGLFVIVLAIYLYGGHQAGPTAKSDCPPSGDVATVA